MIVTKDSDDTVPSSDAPPSYDTLPVSPPSAQVDRKRPIPAWPASSRPIVAGPSASPKLQPVPRSVLDPEYWRQRAANDEIRRTVRALLQDVIHNLSEPGAHDILVSCYSVCNAHGLSFPALSQELIEDHPPLYWAILTYSGSLKAAGGSAVALPPPPGTWPLLDLLCSFPLEKETLREAADACMLGDDNALYQYVVRSEVMQSRGLAESIMRVGGVGPGEEGEWTGVDEVAVEHVSDSMAGHFRIQFEMKDFLRRMRMHKGVKLRWVARGRAWCLTFGIADGSYYSAGTWYLSLQLVKNSGPVPVAGHVYLYSRPEEGKEPSNLDFPFSKSELSPESDQGIRMKISDVPNARTLEFNDSPFIWPDGSLRATGDFVLDNKTKDLSFELLGVSLMGMRAAHDAAYDAAYDGLRRLNESGMLGSRQG